MIINCSAWQIERADRLDTITSRHNETKITGLDHEARLALTNLAGLNTVDVVGMNYERVEETMMAPVFIDENEEDKTPAQWLYQSWSNKVASSGNEGREGFPSFQEYSISQLCSVAAVLHPRKCR